jgi:nucleoside-diphosphate-sugar epimerase/predicted dehydrogenase
MKIAIAGAGNVAMVHGPIIAKQPNAEVVAVADTDLTRAKTAAAGLGECRYYLSFNDMIVQEKPDIIHILTPPQLHAEMCLFSMNQGCHVLVEKPMALTMKDAKKMIAVAQKNKVRLCVNHNKVFANVIQRALKFTSSGILGKVVSVEASYQYDARRYPAITEEGAEFSHWSYRLNGGPLHDHMPHPASLMFEFISEIQEVQTIGYSRGVLPKPWQDEIRVLVKSENAIGYISISLSEKPDTIYLTLKGTKGTILADLFNDILIVRKDSSLPRAIARGLSGFQISAQYLKGSLLNVYRFFSGRVDKSDGLEKLISKFYESIRNGDDSPVSLSKSLLVVDLMTRVWPNPVKDAKTIRPFRSKTTRVKPTVLVTGASGFIGTHLTKKLVSEDIGVRALVRPNSIHAGRLSLLEIDTIEGDLGDPEILYQATKGIETVFHAGSPMSNDWQEYQRVAVEGTKHLVESCLVNGVKRLVHFSSLAVYDLQRISDGKVREETPYRDNAHTIGAYARAKIETEKIVFDAYATQGLEVTVVRPGMVFGPLGRVFFPHFGYRYGDNIFLLIGKDTNPLPLTYVENTVEGIIRAATIEKAVGQAYNLIDDNEVTVREYLKRFTEVTGINPRIIALPYVIPYLATAGYEIAASLGLVKNGVTSRAQLKWKRATVKFDNTKAKSELGWQPEVTIQDGLTKTFQWYARKFL